MTVEDYQSINETADGQAAYAVVIVDAPDADQRPVYRVQCHANGPGSNHTSTFTPRRDFVMRGCSRTTR